MFKYDEKLLGKDVLPIIIKIKSETKQLSNPDFYNLWGVKNITTRNYLHKRIEIANKLLNISHPKNNYGFYQYTLDKNQEAQIMALYRILNQNIIAISIILNIPAYLVSKCIKKKGSLFTIKYCNKCNLRYLSKKLYLKAQNKTVFTPCPHCYENETKYPYEIEPKIIDIPESANDDFLYEAYQPFRRLKQSLKIYEKAKQKGVFNKEKLKTLQYLYEGMLWIFGKTTINFPIPFENNCLALGIEPVTTRKELLNFSDWSEKTVELNIKKRKIEELRISRNIVDFLELVSYYCSIWTDGDEREYFTSKYIQYNIPLLYSVKQF